MRFSCLLALLAALAICLPLAPRPAGAAVLVSENFDDGNWTANPWWQESPASPSVSISSDQVASAPYSLKIDAANSTGAITTATGLSSVTQPFSCTFKIYVQSIPEEGIPWALHSPSGALVGLIFLLPNGRVELTTWKTGGAYVKSAAPSPLAYAQWHTFRVTYDGQTQSLYIDGADSRAASITLQYTAPPARLSIGNFGMAHTGTYYIDDLSLEAEMVDPPGPPGKVYVQFCSDTSTGGLATNSNPIRFPADDYTFVSPTGQAAQVMAESWRNQVRDSLGNTIKLTWYMNVGSIYSCGIDTSPILTYELMMDNHGEAIARWGDEMAYHYHTWAWIDPDGDGVYQWLQTETFAPCLADFEDSTARFILDRSFYPASFRSGWNWMENAWESYLDDWYPYRFEGKYFANGWQPYHPSPDDWTKPGSLRGWESFHDYIQSFGAVDAEDAFLRAEYGTDQVVTLWSHLKEEDYPSQIVAAHGHITDAHNRHPQVQFEYLTGRECMLKWRGGDDTEPPVISLASTDSGDLRTVTITTSEPIYQLQPFVAHKSFGGLYTRLDCQSAGPNSWTVSYPISQTLQAGAGVTDWFGNSAVKALPVPLRLIDVSATAAVTTAAVRWSTSAPVTTSISYTLMPYGPILTLSDAGRLTNHSATIDGLEPGCVYRIRLDAEDEAGSHAQSEDLYVVTRPGAHVVVDNVDPGFSATGTWSSGTTAGGRYGANYRYVSTNPSGTTTATWTLVAPTAGMYRINAWWSGGSNRTAAAPYSVAYRGSSYPILVNQQADGGQWNSLRQFPLAAGETVTVTLSNRAPSGFVVIADAAGLELAFAELWSPGLARLVDDGSSAALRNLIVSASFPGFFYAQDRLRSSGIKVLGSATEGDIVDVYGDLITEAGEHTLANSSVVRVGGPVVCRPLVPDNLKRTPRVTGLLITVHGRVVQSEPDRLLLETPSGEVVQITVSAAFPTFITGQLISATGALGGYPESPVLLARRATDIVLLSP